MVLVEWPPTTGTDTGGFQHPVACEAKVEARTTSSVVVPKSFLGLNLPLFLRTSAIMGTIELTGFVMTTMKASGQVVAMAFAIFMVIGAFGSKRS